MDQKKGSGAADAKSPKSYDFGKGQKKKDKSLHRLS